MKDIDEVLAESRRLRERHGSLWAVTVSLTRKHVALAGQIRSLALSTAGIVKPTPRSAAPIEPVPAAPPPRRAKPGKLRFKHRWLISADVVAALARAGVICDIVVERRGGAEGHQSLH